MRHYEGESVGPASLVRAESREEKMYNTTSATSLMPMMF